MKFCDLHTHSVYSDGSYTPEEIVVKSKEMGLSAIALTDHNTVAGLCEFKTACEKQGMEYSLGVEFSADFMDKEQHIIGHFLDVNRFGVLEDILKERGRKKDMANAECIEKISRLGYNLSNDEFIAMYPNVSRNRVNIARYLMSKSIITSVGEAFDYLLKPSNGFYTPPKNYSAEYIIEKINECGGVPVIAHPLLKMDEDRAEEYLSILKASGLMGMEVLYTAYTPHQTELSFKLSEKLNLLKSGGSDCHGVNKNIPLGSANVPYEFFEILKRNQK